MYVHLSVGLVVWVFFFQVHGLSLNVGPTRRGWKTCLGSIVYQGNALERVRWMEIDGSSVIESPGLGVVPKLISALILTSLPALPLSQYIRYMLKPIFISVFDLFI